MPAKASVLLSSTAPTAIVFEKQPRWAPELERQFLTEEARVIACRSVRDAEERSAGLSCGVLLLDASVATAECLHLLRSRMNDPQALPVVIVASKQIANLEWSFRELGAAAFFSKKIPGHEMASLCRKQWSAAAGRFERPTFRHYQPRPTHR